LTQGNWELDTTEHNFLYVASNKIFHQRLGLVVSDVRGKRCTGFRILEEHTFENGHLEG
jgi:hypothetical protein